MSEDRSFEWDLMVSNIKTAKDFLNAATQSIEEGIYPLMTLPMAISNLTLAKNHMDLGYREEKDNASNTPVPNTGTK